MNALQKEKCKKAFGRLLDIVEELRQKCPWDKKQSLQTLRPLSTEECYELADNILREDFPEIKKELGDVLLHLVFYALICEEKNEFTMCDVIDSINQKLIFRHPHIYGKAPQNITEEEVKKNWEKLKLKEGNASVLSGVSKSLPSIIKAYRMQEKVRGIGFDFDNETQAWAKVKEELQEFKQETSHQRRETEFGDVLFSLINFARITGINADTALERTNTKFLLRFQKMEELAKQKNTEISVLHLQEMEELWQEAKNSVG